MWLRLLAPETEAQQQTPADAAKTTSVSVARGTGHVRRCARQEPSRDPAVAPGLGSARLCMLFYLQQARRGLRLPPLLQVPPRHHATQSSQARVELPQWTEPPEEVAKHAKAGPARIRWFARYSKRVPSRKGGSSSTLPSESPWRMAATCQAPSLFGHEASDNVSLSLRPWSEAARIVEESLLLCLQF